MQFFFEISRVINMDKKFETEIIFIFMDELFCLCFQGSFCTSRLLEYCWKCQSQPLNLITKQLGFFGPFDEETLTKNFLEEKKEIKKKRRKTCLLKSKGKL